MHFRHVFESLFSGSFLTIKLGKFEKFGQNVGGKSVQSWGFSVNPVRPPRRKGGRGRGAGGGGGGGRGPIYRENEPPFRRKRLISLKNKDEVKLPPPQRHPPKNSTIIGKGGEGMKGGKEVGCAGGQE